MDDRTNWPATVDRAILTDLHEHGPDYLPLVANRRGLHLGLVRRRCERLADERHVEKVSEEVVYRITECGVEELEAMRPDDETARGVAGADERP